MIEKWWMVDLRFQAMQTDSSQTSDPCIVRKELLRKTSTELIKECRKCHISTAGNKGQVADRLVSYITRSSKVHRIRKRRNTIAETLGTKTATNHKMTNIGRSRSEESSITCARKCSSCKDDTSKALKRAFVKILSVTDEPSRQLVIHEMENVTKTHRIQTNRIKNQQKQFKTEMSRLRRQIAQKDQDYAILKKRLDELRMVASRQSRESVKKKSKKRRKCKSKDNSYQKKNSRHVSAGNESQKPLQMRYNEAFDLKIEGLSDLHQFIAQYEKDKGNKEEQSGE
eukprot:563879_1